MVPPASAAPSGKGGPSAAALGLGTQAPGVTAPELIHRLEDYEATISTALRVNSHLNSEVERYLGLLDRAEQERDAWEGHAKRLAKLLQQARKQQRLGQSSGRNEAADGNTIPDLVTEEEELAQLVRPPTVAQHAPELSASLLVKEPAPADAQERSAHHTSDPHAVASSSGGSLPPYEPNAAQAKLVAALNARGRDMGWLLDPKEVQLGKVLGEGTFGTTYKGTWRGSDVAVKVVRISNQSELTMFLREVEAMSCLRHPHVVPFLGAALQPPTTFWLVSEFMTGGTLSKWLYPNGVNQGIMQCPPFLQRIDMAWQVAQGMLALESCRPPILHRDLKPTNVFVDGAGRARIGDFGLSRRLLPGVSATLTGETGTYLYMAPEVMRHEVYDGKADVWSWGVLLCELITGVTPYFHTYFTPVQIACAVADEQLKPDVPTSIDADLQVLAKIACDFDPDSRPSFSLLVSEMAAVVQKLREQSAAEGSMVGRLQRNLTTGWTSVMAKIYASPAATAAAAATPLPESVLSASTQEWRRQVEEAKKAAAGKPRKPREKTLSGLALEQQQQGQREQG